MKKLGKSFIRLAHRVGKSLKEEEEYMKPIDYNQLQIDISLIIMDAMFEFDRIQNNGRKNKVFNHSKYSKKIIKLMKKINKWV